MLIVSNRLPLSVVKKNGKISFQKSVGGLATGLGSFYSSYNSLWIGWPGVVEERVDESEKNEIRKHLSSNNCHPVFISQHDVENYYYGFCNKTIWPLFHYFPMYTIYSQNLWEAYKRVNRIFCDEVIKLVKKGDIIWIHDYHLMLLPKLLRDSLKDVTIGFFLHIPFPSLEVFRLLPWRRDLLEGLLGADLIGFHTYDYVRYYLDCVRRILGYEHTLGQITTEDRIVKVDAFPMGIDCESFANAIDTKEVQKEVEKIRKKMGNSKIILSIDRLDYTKGIIERLEVFDSFLDRNPEYKEKITLILVVVPSRTGVDHYMFLKKRVEEIVGKINGKHGTIGWVPIWYLYRSFPFHSLVALYSISDVALVTPLRDGMNLVAKEFIATKRDGKGVLILSEMAGAAKELGEAIIINPNNKEEGVLALKEALTMPQEEQIERNSLMRKRIFRYNVKNWVKDFLDKLSCIKEQQEKLYAKRLTKDIKEILISSYTKGKKRLFLLDYDGTLIPFSERPEKAKPDSALIALLKNLCENPNNEVVIVSGRDRNALDRWFSDLNLGLVAEHGVWIKDKNGWRMIEPLKNEWKEQIRPILELYVDRTPGSFLEEKEFSVVWHYRKADPELAEVRARELKDTLVHFTANLNLGILEGSKVIEVKNVGISKGRAVFQWISERRWDFILAIGDDLTDEETFAVLPESAFSIKVGLEISRAKYCVDSYKDVRKLLFELSSLQT